MYEMNDKSTPPIYSCLGNLYKVIRSACISNEYLNPVQVNIAVIGLSGTSQVKGVSGIGKSSICNRLVRPHQFHKQLSTLTTVDFYSDIINGSHWIYWNYVVKTIDSKCYAFHIIEQTILINEQTYLPFENYTESDYISQAISGKVCGSKRAFICPSQFSKTQDYEASVIADETIIDAFLIVYDVSEVTSRNYQAQDRYMTEILGALHKNRKPLIIVTSKTDVESPRIRSRLDLILEKRNFKSIPLVETSAKLNINISSILTVIGSLMNNNQKSMFTSIKSAAVKFESFELAVIRHEKISEEVLKSLDKLVTSATNKNYDLSWSTFCSENDLGPFLDVIDRVILKDHFYCFHSAAVKKINENVMNLLVVLFKKLIFELVDPLLVKYGGGDVQNIVETLLNDSKFLSNFQETDLSYDEIMKNAHMNAQIDYPLPRFFISSDDPHNKLDVIDCCIEEIRNQKRMTYYSERFLKKLEANCDLYIDMSFSDIVKLFKDEPWMKELGNNAQSTFDEFIETTTKRFKETFDERLLELSFMIYNIEPMKTPLQKTTKKKTLPMENILDMNHIKSVDNKIFFESVLHDKVVLRSHRIKWIVKYMGSILSTNPNQCYIFDFKPDKCCEHLKKYLAPISTYRRNLIAVISGDELVDEFWSESEIAKLDIDTTYDNNVLSLEIQFFPFTSFDISDLRGNRFHGCQKVIVLISDEGSTNSYNILNSLLSNQIASPLQLSVINLAKNLATNTLIDELIKRYNLGYSTIGWSLCPGKQLKKLLHEQTNSYLFKLKPVIIWMVVFCADTYDCNVPFSFVLSIFPDCIIIDRNVSNGFQNISLFYVPSSSELPCSLQISILSYHQAYKWLTEETNFTAPHLMLYCCNLLRLASINTMFAIMQNLSNPSIESIMIAVFHSNDQDPVDLFERKCMIKRMARDQNVDCLLLEEGKEFDKSKRETLLTHIQHCECFVQNLEETKNLCWYNDAFVNDDNNLNFSSSKDSRKAKDFVNFCDLGDKDLKPDQRSSFRNQKFIRSSSNSQDSSDAPPVFDISLRSDKSDKSLDYDLMDCDFTYPLGNFNEELFECIKEESEFTEFTENEDKSTAVLVQCNNKSHLTDESLEFPKTKLSRNNQKLPTSKMRSYSSPIQTNKSFIKKYSTIQNQGNHRSQRLAKMSHSLTTSPLMPAIKSFKEFESCKNHGVVGCFCEISSIGMNQGHVPPPTKSLKKIFSRLFSSERFNKTTEDSGNLLRRSFKLTKRNSEKKGKLIPTKSGTDLQSTSVVSDLTNFPLSHSNSHSILEMRKKAKSAFAMKNP